MTEIISMSLCPKKQSRRPAGLALLLAILLAPGLAPARTIDLNGNGMSDIWELVYGASDLDPNGDADGDGASNLLESIAGTNPFDPNSVPKIVVDGQYDHELQRQHALRAGQAIRAAEHAGLSAAAVCPIGRPKRAS